MLKYIVKLGIEWSDSSTKGWMFMDAGDVILDVVVVFICDAESYNCTIQIYIISG